MVLFSGRANAEDRESTIRDIITKAGRMLASEPNLPAVSIAVLRKGEDNPVSVAFGTACVENDVIMTDAHKIKIGSVTKLFTAALVHKLIEDGKLGLNATVDRFFPDFPRGEEITIEHLLTHTSGVVDMLRLEPVFTSPTRRWKPEELIAMAGAQPLVFAPGTDQRYSNTGYLMLAQISEMASGKGYEEQIRDNFVAKLEMESLAVGQDETVVPQLACGYGESEDSDLILPIMMGIGMAKGTGSLVASPDDVVRLVNLDRMLENNFMDTQPLASLRLANGELAQSTVDKAHGGYTRSFLVGGTVFMFDDPAITLVGQIGSFPGFGTVFFYDRETMFAVTVSVNNEKYIPMAIKSAARILHELRN
ncbi:MAG: class A beta-lactamase-related serine hydrolase [Proteobacteria bacterium]|nr:class A beta-lactamase-related serine hydrolase [Pseudomonadota bacterium]